MSEEKNKVKDGIKLGLYGDYGGDIMEDIEYDTTIAENEIQDNNNSLNKNENNENNIKDINDINDDINNISNVSNNYETNLNFGPSNNELNDFKNEYINEKFNPFNEINNNNNNNNNDNNKSLYYQNMKKKLLTRGLEPMENNNKNSKNVPQYAENMKKKILQKEEYYLKKQIESKLKNENLSQNNKEINELNNENIINNNHEINNNINNNENSFENLSKRKWDDIEKDTKLNTNISSISWDDETPLLINNNNNNMNDETPNLLETQTKKRSRWDQTPDLIQLNNNKKFHDMTPDINQYNNNNNNIEKTTSNIEINLSNQTAWDRELAQRNAPWTDEVLDIILPNEDEGYILVKPPASYKPIYTPARKLTTTPNDINNNNNYILNDNNKDSELTRQEALEKYGLIATDKYETNEAGEIIGDLPYIKPEDYQYFGKLVEVRKKQEEIKLLKEEHGEEYINDNELNLILTNDEEAELDLLEYLLKIKNGTAPQRKSAFKKLKKSLIDDYIKPNLLFTNLLPLMMSLHLEDQERHLLVKVIDKSLTILGSKVQPFTRNILMVVQPLLIDEDYYARVEAKEIISNLSKAVGLPTMIATLRLDLEDIDDYVRNTAARAFAVVASALGIPLILPFLEAVCSSKKSWLAKHTGIKIIQQIAILLGISILPYLTRLVNIIEKGFHDKKSKIRTITALSIASLAEASYPYGFESFENVLEPLWKGISNLSGKSLASYLKAIGFIIPLMDPNLADNASKGIMKKLISEFRTNDPSIKKIVLQVLRQCITSGLEKEFIISDIINPYFESFWKRELSFDRLNYKEIIKTTVEISKKIGEKIVIKNLIKYITDDNEKFRLMIIDCIQEVISEIGMNEIDFELEKELINGLLYCFQQQSSDNILLYNKKDIILNGFSTVINVMNIKIRPYLPQIIQKIKQCWINNDPKVRMQAADLVAKIANVMKICNEEKLMSELSIILYENLGEEYPEVLGSILGALEGIVEVIGMDEILPPIGDLLPRLTPILKNRHEKVQENCIKLVGKIADRGSQYVSAREWMRICVELLEMLRAQKKSIQRATVQTFGFIAKAIGPSDVIHTLLNNLKVQERTNRVCTTVAIGIVAETCNPFTVLPALMNEYRVPDLNVQNGILKTLSFMFEYIGEMAKDYIYSIVTLLEDALIDRDPVHRQTACTAVKHLSLGLYGLGFEDALLHLLNFVWPNIFEESAHVIYATMEAIEGLIVSLGVPRIINYILQGLFHPAKRVRIIYWKLWNTCYIYGAEALAISFPNLKPLNNINIWGDYDDEWNKNHYEDIYSEIFI